MTHAFLSTEWMDAARGIREKYADQVPGSQLIVADRSDHGIPGQQPRLIVDTIIDLIGSIR